MWLQREYGFTPSSSLAQEAVSVLADGNRFHPVRLWLQSLKWDGTPRIAHWLIDFLGADDAEYARFVGKWWLMGAVARAMKPGCKFDYVLVLEGLQGKKKSSAFDALGGEWFGDNDLDFANKDSMLALQGKLIYEIAELGALARSDERKQKSFLSRRFDEFRPPYGRGFVRVPRQLVFCGTTNEWEWNKDPTGGRRFWPIPCKVDEIDVAGIAGVRDQLFAEALHCFEAGERYWPTADEQKKLFDPEQLKIEQPDAFVDALHDWVYGRVALFSLAEAAMDGLKMDASKLTRDIQTRIGTALRKLGCSRVEKRNGMTRFWYKPPQEVAKYVTSQPAQQGDEVGHAPF
jgi:predicted P-loop ATPase